MANRKSSKKKSTRSKRKTASNIDLTIVGLIILSILLCVLIYGNSGTVGVELNKILGGMIGIIKYVLPIGIFAIAVNIACVDNDYITSKILQYAILLLSFSVLISVYQVNKGELVILDKDISNIAKDAYSIRFTRNWRRSFRSYYCNTTY